MEEKDLEIITVNQTEQVALLLNLLKGYCKAISEDKDYYIVGHDFGCTDVFVHGIAVLGDMDHDDLKILAIHSSPMTLIIEDESHSSVEDAVEKVNENYSLSLSADKIKYECIGDK